MVAPSAPRNRWLLPARALCFVVLALVVGITLFDVPFEWVDNVTVCSGATCSSNQLGPADVAQLQQAGISLPFFFGYQIALVTIFVLVFSIVASLIFWRRPNDLFAIFTAITLACAGFAFTVGGPPSPAIVTYYPVLLFPIQLLNVTGYFTFYLFFYLFPDGHFVPRWVRWLVPLAIIQRLLSTFRPDWLGNTSWLVYPALLGAILALIYRYRRVSNTIQRQQTKWVVFGSFVGLTGAACLIAYFAVAVPNSGQGGVGLLIGTTGWQLLILLIPLSIGMAILRSHLWDIDILIRRTLIYAVLTALLALVYLGVVVALQAVFTALTGQQRSELVTVTSTLVIATLFLPLRSRIQSVIDRRLYRRKYDAARTLAQFGAALRDELNLDDLSAHLLTAVDETMQPETVALWLVKPSFGGHGVPSLALGWWMQLDQAKTETEGPYRGPQPVS